MKLVKHKFSDLYKMSSGISSKPEQAGHGYPFVSFSTVFNNYFLPDNLTDLMDASEDERENYSVKKGDIFLTRTSETIDELGMSCVAIRDYTNTTFSGFVKRLRPTQKNVTYDKYMAFYLRSSFFRKVMTNNAIMTLRASLNEDIFSYLYLYLPDYDTQKLIGDFLFQLNSKIELNNRVNSELEAMAKTVYDYWFLQFDFPNEKSKPYKTSGGKMFYSDMLKREIPVDWRIGKLSDVSELVRGVSYAKINVKKPTETGVIPILRATNISGNIIDLEDLVYIFEANVKAEQLLNKYDILMTMSSGSIDHIGKNGFFYFDEKVAFGTFCAKLVAKDDFQFYLYSYTQSEFMFATIKNECLGTNINNLNGQLVCNFKILIPPHDCIVAYNKIVASVYEKIGRNINENRKLSELRDWLLPMLMNGQVKVKNIKERESAVA